MRRIQHPKRWIFSAICGCAWAGYATASMDYLFYSRSAGFTDTEIGLLFAIVGLTSIACQPLFGILCDYFKTTKHILLVSLAFSIVLSLILPLVHAKPAILAIVVCYTVFMCSFMPLFDNWVARECMGEGSYHYGSIRMWGSVGYAIVIFLYGQLTLQMDVRIVYYGRAVFFVACFVLLLLCRWKPVQAREDEESPEKSKPDIKGLFRKPDYILLVIFMFLLALPMNAAFSFFPKLLTSVGGSTATIGLFGSLNAIVEIPFFLYVSRLTKRMGARGLMLTGAAFACVRVIGFALMRNIPGLLVAYLFVAPYSSLYTPGYIFYIYGIAPRNTAAFAQTFAQAISVGLGGMLGNSLGGLIIDQYGITQMYVVWAIVSVFGVLFYVASGYITRRRVRDDPAIKEETDHVGELASKE